VHDEALSPAGEVINITQVRREGLATTGWRCAGASPEGVECLRPVQARALNSDFVAAYFAGPHIGGCNRRSKRSEDEPGDRGYVALNGPRATQWRLCVDEVSRVGRAERRRPDDAVSGEKTRRSVFDGTAPPTNVEEPHALSAFLDAALRGQIPDHAALPGGHFCRGTDLIVEAADATAARFGARELIVWGRIVATRPTPFGGTMLVLEGAADGLAVLIRDELRGYYPLVHDDEFKGRYVMTYGPKAGAETRPYVAVPAPRAVVFSPSIHVRSTPVRRDEPS